MRVFLFVFALFLFIIALGCFGLFVLVQTI